MTDDSEYLNQLKTLLAGPHNFSSNLSKSKKYDNLKNWIISKTTPLLSDEFYTLGTRIFFIINGFDELPKCANHTCNKTLKINFTAYDDPMEFYSCHCSSRCVQLDPNVKRKIENTTLKRHGCRRGRHDKEFHDSVKNTFIKKYGSTCSFNTPHLREKAKATSLERYGYEYPQSSVIVKEKIRNTCNEKYGVDCVFQADEIKEKIKTTVEEKYGVDVISKSPEIQGKIQDTMLKRYGSTSYLGTDECLEKTKKFYQEKFGVDHLMQVPEIREKMQNTNIEKYGHMIAFGYGTDEFKEMMIERYGAPYAAQIPEFQNAQKFRYVYNSISFDSAPELAYYIWLTDHNVQFEYSPAIRIQYEFNGKKHFYMPDFIVDGQLIELKGDHFFNENGEMMNPFRYPDWSDEQYKQSCALYEAKRQCMLNNNVKILKSDDYSLYIRYIENKYGKDFLKRFKNDNIKI